MKDVLTPAQLAKQMGVSEETILGWRDLGMPWVKIGKFVFVLGKSFLSWMKGLEKVRNAQDAPERDFIGRSLSNHEPPKN